MNSLPSGTVTFLFTDIEGSTKLAQNYPEEMPALLARHNQILHQAIEAHDGYVFRVVGDSFAVAFHSASDALNAALDAQRNLHNESWTPAPIKVRMGIHTGAAQLQIDSKDNAYSGYATLASTQRIMSAGHGGQILLSGATRELVRDTLPVHTELFDLGEKRLKDLLRPEHLYQLNIAGLPTTFPPLKTLDSFPNNLPVQLTSFIGRENEIVELKQELESHRLVTLTGSGGTGKTRLSLQVATELLEKFDHGLWFIELAPLANPDLIPQTILSAIGVSEQPNKTPLDILKEYLHEKKVLIVLDNCEHLVTASAQVANALLNAAPGLKVLASSREALGVKGELSYPVPSLSLPDPKHLPTIEQLSQYESVRLFIDRTLLVAPHFVVDKDNAPFIAQICYRLDGIPLAIELAASRVKLLSVEQIASRLDDAFRLLTGGSRTALPRQQTLRALIDWSYNLLSEHEKILFRRLAVFAGGWTMEAAESVCSGEGVEQDDVLDLMAHLVDKSLIMVTREGTESRYRRLETIRQYAREKFLEAGGSEITRDRHLAYYVKLVEQAEPELYRSNQLRWLNRLDDELDNLRMALEWALATNIEAGMWIAALPWRFWDGQGHWQEVAKWLTVFLDRYHKTDTLHVHALVVLALYFYRQNNFPETIRLAEQGLQMARALSDKQLEALSLSLLGVVTHLQGNVGEGVSLLEKSIAISRTLGDKISQADTLGWLSLIHHDNEAMDLSRESLRLYREFGHLSGIKNSLITLARETMWRGDFSSPVPWLDEALSISRQLGDKPDEAMTLTGIGILAYWKGDYGRANEFYEEAIILSEKIGFRTWNLFIHVHLAYAILRQGEIQRAFSLFEDSIRNTQKAGFMIALIYAMEGLASLNVNQEQPERAAQLFAWADTMRKEISNPRPPVEQNSVEKDLVSIHAQVDDATFEKLWDEGSKLTTEEAIDLALEKTPS